MIDAPVADWRRNQAAVTTAAFVGFTGFTLVMPFLPLYFEQLGVRSPAAVALWSGFSLGVTPAVTAAMAPVWARVAERTGKKLMVGRSLGSFVVIMSLMAFVTAPWQVFVLRAIQGLFAGYGAIAMTMAAESAPPEHLARAIGWVQTAQRLGPALGPIIGGVLAEAVGLRQTFLVAALFYLAACVLVFVGYTEGRLPVNETRTSNGQAVRWADLRRVPHFAMFVGLVFGLQLVDRSFGPVLPLYLREIGAASDRIAFLSGLMFTAMAAAAAAGNQATAWALARWRVAGVVASGTMVSAASAATFALAPGLPVLITAAVLFGAGIGVATTAIYTAASGAVAPEGRGVAFGYLSRAYLVGLAISPVAAGALGAAGTRAVFVADAAALTAVVWLIRRRSLG